LGRIESEAFSSSWLESIMIWRNVQLIDGSAFMDVNLSSTSIELGSNIFDIDICLPCPKLVSTKHEDIANPIWDEIMERTES
jgi:hypothetical protein